MRRWLPLLLLIVVAGCRVAPAGAETLTLSPAARQVAIGSTFSGAQLVAFGVIERDEQTVARPGRLDVVLTVLGPRESLTVRRKEALGPVWLNRAQQKFFAIPSLIGLYSNAPLPAIATLDQRRRLKIGIEPMMAALSPIEGEVEEAPFRTALVRLKSREGLYTEDPEGVVFMTESAFRASINLPATAPIGLYEIQASVLSDGVEVARRAANFQVVKVGFEERVTELARDQPLEYGLATAAMALLFGWFATVIFRRD